MSFKTITMRFGRRRVLVARPTGRQYGPLGLAIVRSLASARNDGADADPNAKTGERGLRRPDETADLRHGAADEVLRLVHVSSEAGDIRRDFDLEGAGFHGAVSLPGCGASEALRRGQ